MSHTERLVQLPLNALINLLVLSTTNLGLIAFTLRPIASAD